MPLAMRFCRKKMFTSGIKAGFKGGTKSVDDEHRPGRSSTPTDEQTR